MKTYPINSIYLKNRMAELGLKQWWLAEQIGVDKKTILRWRDGVVKTIKSENLESLIQILECTKEDLIQSEGDFYLATVDEQKNAAKLLMASSIVDKLGPIGEWNVIESLLKATIVENLPLSVLGEMYAQLTVSLWRQSKINEADHCNKKTEEIARRLDDKILLAKALLSKANIYSWEGNIKDSIKTYQECLSLEKYIEEKLLGAIHSNLGAAYFEVRQLILAKDFQLKAISHFQFGGKPTNLSIAYCHLSFIHLEQKELKQARDSIIKSIEYAKIDEYKRGLSMGALVLSEIEAYENNIDVSLKFLSDGLEGFKAQGIAEGLNFEFAGRVLRILGQFQKSKEMLLHGISLSKNFPLSEAALNSELGKTLKLLNDKNYIVCFERAIELYKSSEVEERVKIIQEYVT